MFLKNPAILILDEATSALDPENARLVEELLLREDRSNLPSLVCLPVSYAPGGTTKE